MYGYVLTVNNFNLAKIINPIEKILLGIIAFFTIIVVVHEIYSIYINGKVKLADLILLFIYTEVLGMIDILYLSNKNTCKTTCNYYYNSYCKTYNITRQSYGSHNSHI